MKSSPNFGDHFEGNDFDRFFAECEMGTNPWDIPWEENKCNDFIDYKEQFVRQSRSWHSNPYKIDALTGKHAVHAAAETKDSTYFERLQENLAIDVNRKYKGQTPLNILISSLDRASVGCIESLLQYGASPNIATEDGVPPILHAIRTERLDEQEKEVLIKIFLKCDNLDLDGYNWGEARRLLSEQFSNIELPTTPMEAQATEITFGSFYRYYGDNSKPTDYNESGLLRQLHKYFLQPTLPVELQKTEVEEQNAELIGDTIRKNMFQLFHALRQIDFYLTQHEVGDSASKYPFPIALWTSNLYAFRELLHDRAFKPETANSFLWYVIGYAECTEEGVIYKVIDLLIKLDHLDVNCRNKKGESLFYFVDNRAPNPKMERIMQAFLKRGAYIAIRNENGQRSLKKMSSQLLEDHLDSCVTTNKCHPNDADYEIYLDYKNIKHPASQSANELPFNRKLQSEVDSIVFFSESSKYKRLLQHPLLTSFALLKWHQISMLFYLNFMFHGVFTLSMCLHAFCKFGFEHYAAWMTVFALLSWICLVLLIARESFQFYLSPKEYFRTPVNLMETALIVFASWTLIDGNTSTAVSTILLMAWDLSLLIGSVPHLFTSTLILMWNTVLITFVKCLPVFFIFLLQFSLCFYLLNDASTTSAFTNFFGAVFKTFVMLTGELEAGSLNLNSVASYVVFVLFVLLMTIVLLNLLNGLAVSDTQAIKTQAELNGSIMRVKLLLRYVDVINSKFFDNKCYEKILRLLIDRPNNYSNCTNIAISPNQNNKVEIFINKNDPTQSEDLEMRPLNGTLKPLSYFKTNFIDFETVTAAVQVIERKSIAENEATRLKENETRRAQVENQLIRHIEKWHQIADIRLKRIEEKLSL